MINFANDKQIIRPMFENETNKLREDIALWEELLETDVRQDPKFEEHLLLSLFAGTQVHIEALKSNIPYESLDEPKGLADELADDTLEEAEVEDEVVEIDRLIDKAYELMGLAQAKYYPEGLPVPEPDITAEKTEESIAPDKPANKRKRRLDNASQLGVFIVVLLVIIVLVGLIFGD